MPTTESAAQWSISARSSGCAQQKFPLFARLPPFRVIPAREFARRYLGIEPDPKQMELLQFGVSRGILNCSRQWGKSTVAAIRAVHHAYTRGKSLVIVASASRRQSNELLGKIKAMLGKLGIPPKGDGVNTPSAVLLNGSRIVGLPGREDTTRGFSSVSLMLIDEAARVSDRMYKSLRPMLAVSNGDLWLMSTASSFAHNGPFGLCAGQARILL